MTLDRPAGVRGALLLALYGVAISTVASMCGVGGGIFAVPLLHYMHRLELRRAVATSLCLVFATSFSSTVAELVHPSGVLLPRLAAALVLGALLGARVGHRLARSLPTRGLKLLFTLVFVIVGLRLLLDLGSSDSVVALPVEPVLRARTLAAVLAIGFGAGILVPLLGVGGGLLAVPAQLLLLPELGYLAARASSLAMATVISAVSIARYAREGRIDLARGACFAAGAVLGAVLGVWVVHLPGATVAAQAILAMILFVAAVRFLFDASRRSAL